MRAITSPLNGRPAWRARCCVGLLAARPAGGLELRPVEVNGQPGAQVLDSTGTLIGVIALDISDGQVQAVRSIVNPEKLSGTWGRWPTCAPFSAGKLHRDAEPAAARGARVRVPSWAWAMLLTIARPRPTPAWSVRMRSVPRWNGSTSVATSCGRELLAGVLDGEHHASWAATLVVTHTVPCSGRLWTIALCTRFVVICSSSAGEPTVGAASPEVSMVTPRFSASGSSVSVASSASERQVDVLAGEGPLVGAAEQEQRLGEVDRPGVDGVEAVDELAVVAVRVACGRRRAGSA